MRKLLRSEVAGGINGDHCLVIERYARVQREFVVARLAASRPAHEGHGVLVVSIVGSEYLLAAVGYGVLKFACLFVVGCDDLDV